VYEQVGTNRFVRGPHSRGWVWEGDLPVQKGKAMYDRIYREAAVSKRSLVASGRKRDAN
jgi:hypothetical protein